MESAHNQRVGTWEASIGTLPFLFGSPLPKKLPAVFLVEHESYFIFGIELVGEEADKTSAFRVAVTRSIKKHNLCPASFMVKQADADALAPVAKDLGVPVIVAAKLSASTQVKRSAASAIRNTLDTVANVPRQEFAKQYNAEKSETLSGVYDVHQFKISLNNITPAVWRRIRVPSDFSFGELSMAIMEAFGWSPGYHLHGYAIQPIKTNARELIFFGPPDPNGEDSGNRDERKKFIAEYFGSLIKQCVFTYDYGDNWDHTVLFEGIFPAERGKSYPKLIIGKNATPPDDCGGPWGYNDLLKILKTPRHPRHNEMLEWLGIDEATDFDPLYFNLAEIQFGTRDEYREFLKSYDARQ